MYLDPEIKRASGGVEKRGGIEICPGPGGGGVGKEGGGMVGRPMGRGVGEGEDGVRGIWEEEDGVDKVDVGGSCSTQCLQFKTGPFA